MRARRLFLATWLTAAACATLDPEPRVPEAPVVVAEGPWVDPRLPAPATGRFDATEIRVAWKGAVGAPASVTRTEEEALTLARDLHRRAVGGEDVVALARSTSDAPSGRRDGRVGTFEAGTFDPAFESALAAVPPGAVAPLIRTSAGWHVLRREPVDEIRVCWALWAWRGAVGARVSRSKLAAERAAVVGAEALRHGATPRATGPDLASPDEGEIVGRAQWVPMAEAAAFGLAPGEVAGPIDLPNGFLVVERR